jgi:hypothetical protein
MFSLSPFALEVSLSIPVPPFFILDFASDIPLPRRLALDVVHLTTIQ